MSLHKIHRLHLHPSIFHVSQATIAPSFFKPPHFLSRFRHLRRLSLSPNALSSSPLFSRPPVSLSKTNSKRKHFRVSEVEAPLPSNKEEAEDSNDDSTKLEYLAPDGEVYQKTLRLVECSMFAAISGLAYLLSNSLAIENYFGCFFALPIVISSMRWDIAAGRKTMVATAVLLFVLAGPVKALTYLLMHGLVGFTMGTMWRLRTSWGLSILLCTFARAVGAMGYVLISSFLIRENILALITMNIHASATYMLTSLGLYRIPSMQMIYAFFGIVLLLNCGFFVFLLHLLYAVFFTRLGMKASLKLPRWLEKAI